jgi:hypothetical protein
MLDVNYLLLYNKHLEKANWLPATLTSLSQYLWNHVKLCNPPLLWRWLWKEAGLDSRIIRLIRFLRKNLRTNIFRKSAFGKTVNGVVSLGYFWRISNLIITSTCFPMVIKWFAAVLLKIKYIFFAFTNPSTVHMPCVRGSKAATLSHTSRKSLRNFQKPPMPHIFCWLLHPMSSTV